MAVNATVETDGTAVVDSVNVVSGVADSWTAAASDKYVPLLLSESLVSLHAVT